MAHRQVRWGLLSTARINERMIPCIRATPRCDLVAVASRDATKAQTYAHQWGIPRAYGSYEQLLADSEIDVVYVSLPNGLHAPWTVKAADAAKHVLCEKPLALTTEEVDRMIEAADRNGVVIQEAAMMRFHPQTRYMQQLVAQRAVGDIRIVRGVFSYVLTNETDVRHDPEQGGGSLWDLGSYCVSFMRTVLQAEPVEVLGSAIQSDRGVDMSFSAQMRFASGTIAQFFSSLQTFAHVEADLYGTEGRIQLTAPWVNQSERDVHVRVIRHDGSPPRSTWDDGMDSQATKTQTYENANAYQHQVDAMAASVLDGAAPTIPLTDSRKNVATIRALLQSARTGKAVCP